MIRDEQFPGVEHSNEEILEHSNEEILLWWLAKREGGQTANPVFVELCYGCSPDTPDVLQIDFRVTPPEMQRLQRERIC